MSLATTLKLIRASSPNCYSFKIALQGRDTEGDLINQNIYGGLAAAPDALELIPCSLGSMDILCRYKANSAKFYEKQELYNKLFEYTENLPYELLLTLEDSLTNHHDRGDDVLWQSLKSYTAKLSGYRHITLGHIIPFSGCTTIGGCILRYLWSVLLKHDYIVYYKVYNENIKIALKIEDTKEAIELADSMMTANYTFNEVPSALHTNTIAVNSRYLGQHFTEHYNNVCKINEEKDYIDKLLETL